MKNKIEARYWKPEGDGAVECLLCPHHCRISPGKRGICGIRTNDGGKLIASAYGLYPAVHLDPIEKKPLNHFLPGEKILSLGSIGCNLTCLHCQNWSLSRERPDGMAGYYLPPEVLIDKAMDRGSMGVSFTYNEPTINFEYIMDTAPALRKKGAKIVHVTNGHLEEDPWNDLMENCDGANIDVKGFTEDFYTNITGGHLQPVLDNVKTAVDKGVHVEIAYLVIPGYNDDDKQVEGFIEWVLSDLGPSVPVHFNRFHPDHKMLDVPATPSTTLFKLKDRAMDRGIHYVFIGNLGGSGLNDTHCPKCGKKVITRDVFLTRRKGLKDGSCANCGTTIPGVWS
jgi:pyruvate formate lyase activating enzyme